MTGVNPLEVYYGHHRCGSTWIKGIVEQVCADLRLRHANVHRSENFNQVLGEFIAERQVDFLSYTNANYQYALDLPDHRGFHVVRDPRDVVISSYFSHRYSHPTNDWPELAAHRKQLERVSEADGLMLELECRRTQFEEMLEWDYEQANVLELKMEDLMKSPAEFLTQAFIFLGLVEPSADSLITLKYLALKGLSKILAGLWPEARGAGGRTMPLHYFLNIVYNNRFSAWSGGRQAGQEDIYSHYRKGVHGDWATHFNAEHIAAFQQAYNPLLLKLGYETQPDWAGTLERLQI